jgi:hypothetical protein
MDPENLSKYGRIWANDEYPTLKSRFQLGGYGAPSRLVAVDAANPNTDQYLLDFKTLKVIGLYNSKRDETGQNISTPYEDIQKRDDCDANVAYEPPNEDWFG